MRNPLRKRYLREIKTDFGKYLVIFLFLVMLISLVSGFLVVDNNFKNSVDEGLVKYNIEDGHITFNIEPEDALLETIEKKAGLKFTPLFYFDETFISSEKTLRVYKDRESVNTECVLRGKMPESEAEIAIDRMFADNNGIDVGDTVVLKEKELLVTGLIAVPDYSCLYENNSDMVFDAQNFGVAVMTEEGFESVESRRIKYNYAWKYDVSYTTDKEAKEKSDRLLEVLKDEIKEYDIDIYQLQVDSLYDCVSVCSEALGDEFENAATAIEERVKAAGENAAKKALEGLDTMKLYELVLSGLDGEALVEEACRLQNTTLIELTAKELGITEEALSALSDAFEKMEETSMPDTDKRLDLHEFENVDDYENDMDFSFDDIETLLDKINATGLYDTKQMGVLSDRLKELSEFELDDSAIVDVSSYVPRYANNAINFARDDMGGDAASFTVFSYLVIIVLAFVFAVTITNTITKEAGVIGTLRASGYSRGELLKHYLVLPMAVTLLAAVIGNILGYTLLKQYFVNMYYNSYSLATYEDLWNREAFITTTVVPVCLMFVINLWVLASKLKLTPLKFLRRELSKKRKKKALRLSRKLPFMFRFRLRILLQNIPAYLTLFVGIFFGAVLVVFGSMFGPLLSDYSDMVIESRIADYQYVLMEKAETEVEGAEKYCLTSLDCAVEGKITDEISIMGIKKESAYIHAEIPEGEVLISNGVAEKYGLKAGDDYILEDHFDKTEYKFKVAGTYTYDAALTVFMNYEDYLSLFMEEEDYYTGYLSNKELRDIDEDSILTVITISDLTKLTRQITQSIGDFVALFKVFGVIMFVLLMYLMTKQIIESNQVSISMTKILGFKDAEIGGLYLVITSVVVLASLLICIPITDASLRWIFHSYMYTMMSGYIPYIVSNNCYVVMVVLGVISYAVVCCFMMIKINRIPKSEALKNVE